MYEELARPSSANSANSDQRVAEHWRDVPTVQAGALDDFSVAQALQREELRAVSELGAPRVNQMSTEELDFEVQRIRQLSEDEELARALHDAERRQVRREAREQARSTNSLQLGAGVHPEAIVSSYNNCSMTALKSSMI